MPMRKIRTTKLKMRIAIATLLSIATICGVLFYNGILHIHRPSRDKFPIQGIDVSEHQGEIDWTQIDRRAVNFVFIKATEGGDFRDRQFTSLMNFIQLICKENLRNIRFGLAISTPHQI
jgi:GH25 family lysozyme M1 (1,4-beta-N-acetylmuramidase)